jgi:hypothetical protein
MNKIYACYIVYDEADKIAMSLNSIIPYVDKVVIIDGAFASLNFVHSESTDGTKEIAEKICGDKLIWVDCPKTEEKYVPWNNETEKRNAYLECVPLDAWFYIMDADVIVTGNVAKLFNELRGNNTYNGDEMIAVRMMNFYPVLSEDSRKTPPKIKQMLWTVEQIEKSGLANWFSFKDEKKWNPSKLIISPVNWIGYYGPVVCIYKKLDGMQYKNHHDTIVIGDEPFTKNRKWETVPYILSLNMKMLNSFERHYAMACHKRKEDVTAMIENHQPKLLICTPFCNEDHSISLYVEGLLRLDYPKELIDLIWIENCSSDDTWECLKKAKDEITKNYSYHSFILYQKSSQYYDKIEKQCLDEYLKTGIGGKVGVNNPMNALRHRPAHQIGIWNDMLDAMTDEHEFVLFIFADVVVQEDTIKRFIEDFKTYHDAGWFGVVMHRRFERHQRIANQNPMHFGLNSPTLRTCDDKHINKIFAKGCPEWIENPSFISYRIRGITDEEVLELQAAGHGIFQVCCTGHVFMIPRKIIKQGFKFRLFNIESGIGAEIDLAVMGYKMYCDSFIYAKHISVDGKIYRTSLSSGCSL